MHWRKRDLWKAAVVIGGVLFLALMTLVTVSAADAHASVTGAATAGTVTVQATPTVQATVTALQKEQLTQQIAEGQHTFANWFWNNGAALVSSLVLAIAGVFTLFRYLRDRQSEQEKQRSERGKQREDQLIEQAKRDEERFQALIASLGSNNIEARAGAAIMLRTFLQPGYSRFYQQIFDLAVTHLRLRRIDPDAPETVDPLSVALITVFKESFPLARNTLGQIKSAFETRSLDVSCIRLDGAFLAWSDLNYIWMLETSLSKANLAWAKLSNAMLSRANLSGANLNSADLSGANLKGAKFKDVSSLKKTKLRNVKGLSKEQLADCKAKGAIIDEDTPTKPSQLTVSPVAPAQDDTTQAPAVPPAPPSQQPS